MHSDEHEPALQEGARKPWYEHIRESLRGQHHDYTSGSLKYAIFLLSVPMVLEMSMESIFAVCDVYFVSRLGDAAVATVGFTESMLTIIYALAIGMSMATTAMVARRVGEKNIDGAVRASTQAVIVGVLFGALTGIPAAIFAPELLELMGAEPEVIEEGSGYTSILLGTNIVITLLFLNNAIFRGAGDAVLAMRVLIFANGINLILDPCLIFGIGPIPALGVKGAAIATSIGRGCGVLYQFWALRRGTGRVILKGPACRVSLPIMRELLRLSVGGIVQFLIATTSWIALMRIVGTFGSSAVAGYTIAIRIIIFALMPAWGLSNAAATLVGQNLGAGKPDRAERSVLLTGWFNTGFLGLVTVIFFVFSDTLVSFFTESPETIKVAGGSLRVISLGYVFYAWGMVLTQAFNGAGDTWTPTKINFFCFWLCQVPGAYLLAEKTDLGPSGVFWAVAGAETLLALTAFILFSQGSWKETQMAPDAAEIADAASSDVPPPNTDS